MIRVGKMLTVKDQYFIKEGLEAGLSLNEMARRLGVNNATISRNVKKRGGALNYDPTITNMRFRVEKRNKTKESNENNSPKQNDLEHRVKILEMQVEILVDQLKNKGN